MNFFFVFFFTVNISFLNIVAATSLEIEKSKPSIVFVHTGEELPPYLLTATEQASLFNPDCPIYVIGNRVAFKTSNYKFDANVHCISCEDLPISGSHRIFLASSKLDKESLQGFWRFTSERFFYLEEFIRNTKLENVFHLENDVMLYVDLNELMPILKKNYPNMIAATFDSDTRCIPGFMYISNTQPLTELVKLMASQAYTGKNDMEMFQEFKNLYYQSYIDHLPIINPQYAKDYGLKNTLNAIAKHPEMYFRLFEDFQSIFDAAAIGQYLGGISPRNGSSPPGFINETCFFNPSFLSFIWKEDSKGRQVPYVVYGNVEYRINNLHIHSKNLDNFCSRPAK